MKNEMRLWDTQYVQIACANNNFSGWDVDEAVAYAIQETEKAMARNIADNKWPPPRAINAGRDI